MPMTEAAIDTGLLGDLYVSLGEPVRQARRRLGRARVQQAVRRLDLGRLLPDGARRLLAISDRRYRARGDGADRRRSPARAPAVRRAMKSLRCSSRSRIFVVLVGFLCGRPDARPARGALAADRQAGAGVRARAAARSRTRRSRTADMKGKVWLLNVWASWCVSCRVEHPLLVELAKANVVPIVGLNYKDKRDGRHRVARAARRSLHARRSSTPTAASASTGASTACPRPSSIDKQRRHPLQADRPDDAPRRCEQKILPLVRELQKA